MYNKCTPNVNIANNYLHEHLNVCVPLISNVSTYSYYTPHTPHTSEMHIKEYMQGGF